MVSHLIKLFIKYFYSKLQAQALPDPQARPQPLPKSQATNFLYFLYFYI